MDELERAPEIRPFIFQTHRNPCPFLNF
ncbi:hypothetical protein PENSTE_c007G01822 [Penicillium steckii]|uniref:Uncharacterized protein n=1 Tax=Penicillium steckii TaxID=303698 RepID=A0A1V6TEL3_9EURO|nr:hypothetical protein PENSTE_c007G01822 [Penicillium steckii]